MLASLCNRQSLILGCFALVIGSALSLLNWITAPRILDNQTQHIADTLAEVLPLQYGAEYRQFIIKQLNDPESQTARTAYIIQLYDKPPAVVLTATATDGYAGDINLLVGITHNGTISGARVTQHQETPGLGDDIDIRKSNWILQFDGTSQSMPGNWAVRRDGGDFDQLTGATITPRAIVHSVKQTLSFYHENKALIFSND